MGDFLASQLFIQRTTSIPRALSTSTERIQHTHQSSSLAAGAVQASKQLGGDRAIHNGIHRTTAYPSFLPYITFNVWMMSWHYEHLEHRHRWLSYIYIHIALMWLVDFFFRVQSVKFHHNNLRSNSHTNQEPWPCNCEGPWLSSKGHTGCLRSSIWVWYVGLYVRSISWRWVWRKFW